MSVDYLLLPVLIPLGGSILALIFNRVRGAREAVVLSATLLNLLTGIFLFNKELYYGRAWFSGFDFLLRLYPFSSFGILAISFFVFLISLYSCGFLKGKLYAGYFYFYLLLCTAFAQGAMLADHLIVLLFFWEGLLISLFGMIAITGPGAFKTATKAFIIVGIADLCMMVGIAITGFLAKTLTISKLHLGIEGWGAAAFLLLFIGAISKAGSMPFHTWIPDAATDAPLPFMALIPGALEKLVGIYLLTRISLDMFRLDPHSGMSILMMAVGAATILLAVMMALIQKDYKRLLSYHAISQVGYMVLGIGTALPVGIIGGLFHMLNNALYKSCLFLTAGAVERQAGTTSLSKLGGLRFGMPVTFVCFVVTAASISGVPPFNGFFSKELVYEAALERGLLFYLAALAGSFFTAASFLKLGHAAFIGKTAGQYQEVKEAPWGMLLPMIMIAFLCTAFGLFNSLPINSFFMGVLGEEARAAHHFSGWPQNPVLVVSSLAVLLGAALNHYFGVRSTGSGLKASDHIHYAPFLHALYDKAEQRRFDPFEWGMSLMGVVSRAALALDRIIDWIYDGLAVGLTGFCARQIKGLHSGSYSLYLGWGLIATAAVIFFILGV